MSESYLIELRPTPEGKDHLDREPAYRLRIGLKVLLRAFGLRCTKITPTNSEDDSPSARGVRGHPVG